MLQLGGKTRELQLQVKTLQDTLGPLKVDREWISKELGVERAVDVIALVRRLESRIAELEPQVAATAAENADYLNDPAALLAKLRQFSGKIENMNETVASMEAQLISLYADKETLEKEIGASEVDDVIAAFGSLQMTITAMESQLMTLYAGREHFETEIGESDPHVLVKTFKTVARLVRAMDNEMGEFVFARLEADASLHANNLLIGSSSNSFLAEGVNNG
jgi:chromosome segregation ATPase